VNYSGLLDGTNGWRFGLGILGLGRHEHLRGQRFRGADAILIVTPEYNYSVPGILKNAIDWASRPYGDNAWNDKPVAIMGGSPGLLRTARAQLVLRPLLTFLNGPMVNQPESHDRKSAREVRRKWQPNR
jgi:NAD(P)H-dependent FMN reductase